MKKPYLLCGIILKGLRKRNDLTQKDLSIMLGVHVQFVSNWERGKCLPPRDVEKKIWRKIMTENERISYEIAYKKDCWISHSRGL